VQTIAVAFRLLLLAATQLLAAQLLHHAVMHVDVLVRVGVLLPVY
jgi:hypothetical protein